jgi:hypothetical protein
MISGTNIKTSCVQEFPSYKATSSEMEKNLVRGVASLKADNLVVFYLGLIRGCGLWWEGLYNSGTTVNDKTYNAFFINNYKYPFSHVKNEKKIHK